MSHSNDGDLWKLDQHSASLRCGPLTATIDATHPERGLQQINFRSVAPNWKMLSLTAEDARQWPATIAENYLRGNDFVATYETSKTWPYAPQIYWRIQPSSRSPGILVSIGLLVSVQTQLLDTHPLVNAMSTLPSADAHIISLCDDGEANADEISTTQRRYNSEWGDCCLLRRLPDCGISFAEFMPATDFRRLHVSSEPNGLCSSRWELFSDFLEKGVIRKAQLQVALLDIGNDIEVAAEWCRKIRAQPLPLTT